MAWPPPTIQAPPEGDRVPEGSGHGEPAAPAPVTGAYDAPGMQPLPDAQAPAWLSRPELLVGSVLGGRYRITAVLGLGPMGIACEGESPRGRQVTLKVIPKPAELSAERFAWLVREALALAHFDHAHVVPSTDFGSLEDGSAFISRSRVPGAPLRSLLLRQGALPLRRALSIAQQIAGALAAAHAQDICHGRLKPENVILQAASPAEDLVRVVDFGLSRLPLGAGSAIPEARQLELRSRMYLPGADLVGAAHASSLALDVYSLGVLLFEMIAGRLPFALDEA
ncbi:MAG TPA: protein kinase, partial [Polyangiaceae bacterium]|nr:protein kinase [Polyangiaceae bacterium]